MRILSVLFIMIATAYTTQLQAEIIYGESDIINLSGIPTSGTTTKQIKYKRYIPSHTLSPNKPFTMYTLYGRQMKSVQSSDLPAGVYFTDKELFIINR